MKLQLFRRVISVVALTTCCLAVASAQLTDLRSTQEGKGSLNFRTRSSSSSINRVSVLLRRDGYFEVNVLSGGSEKFSGSWHNSGNRSVRLEVKHVGSDRASGSGTLTHDGRGSFTKLDLSGSVGNTRFSLDFNTSNNGGGLTELRSTRNGSGTITFLTRASNARATRVTINLLNNNEFEVRVFSGASDSFKGRWWSDSDRVVNLDVDRLGNTYATGSGKVYLDGRGSFDRVTLSGSGSNYRYNLDFSSGDTGPGGDFDGFRDVARKGVRKKFNHTTSFEWYSETIGEVVFGNRTVKGEFRAKGGNNPGHYRYTVVLGAGTGSVKSVNYSRF